MKGVKFILTFSELLTFIIEHINTFLSWKTLGLSSLGALILYIIKFFPRIYDKIYPMYTIIEPYIYWILVLSFIGTSYKLLCQAVSSITNKIKTQKEHLQLLAIQQKNEYQAIQKLLSLSNNEIAILKFILDQPTCSAWLPKNLTEAILLRHKGYIEIISKKRSAGTIFDDMDIQNFYKNNYDILYTLNADIKKLIESHQKEILPVWQEVRINKDFNIYQN